MMELIGMVPPWVWILLVAFGVIQGTVAYLILLERKVASWVQDRLGPNRVGPGGLLQPIADGLKFVLKEDYRSKGTDRVLFTVAPAIMIVAVLLGVAVIPWGGIVQGTKLLKAGVDPGSVIPAGTTLVSVTPGGAGMLEATYRYAFQVADLNIGVLFIVAVLSLAVYGIVIGGWASNNKFSFLGGLRATAQMISYEIPLGLSLLTVVVMFGTLDLNVIVEKQAHYWLGVIPAWNVFCQPLAFLMFLVCIHAEANRAPFDLAEAEQELVGGYHTEYSSMRFALFFLAEYTGMIITSAVCVALFFGGWHFPGLTGNIDPTNPAVTTLGMALLRAAVYFAKVVGIVFLFMWVRWSLPRFRFDQLMMLAWRAMIPIALAMLMVTAVVVYYFGMNGERPGNMEVSARMALTLLGANAAILVSTMALSVILPAPPATNRRIEVG